LTGVLQAKIPVKVNPVSVLSQIWAYGLAVLLTFLVTLGCFPAITVRVSARHRRVIRSKIESKRAPIAIGQVAFVLFKGFWIT
jgi:hypothetical protein